MDITTWSGEGGGRGVGPHAGVGGAGSIWAYLGFRDMGIFGEVYQISVRLNDLAD